MATLTVKLTSNPSLNSILVALSSLGCKKVEVLTYSESELVDYFDYHKGEKIHEFSPEYMNVKVSFTNDKGETSNKSLSIYANFTNKEGGWIAPRVFKEHTHIQMTYSDDSTELLTKLCSYFGGYVIPLDFYPNEKPDVTYNEVKQTKNLDTKIVKLSDSLTGFTYKERQQFLNTLFTHEDAVREFMVA